MNLRLKQILSATFILLASAPAWAHPVSARSHTASIHDRGPQAHDREPATRRGR